MQPNSTLTFGNLQFKLLYHEQQILKIVDEIASKINSYYEKIEKQEPGSVYVICVLKGAYMFFSDLLKRIKIPVKIEFITASSYQGGLESKGKVKIGNDIDPEKFKGKNVLIVEDIHDTGKTLKKLVDHYQNIGCKRVDVAVLFLRPDKPIEVDIKFKGLFCGDFIIGYGLDLDEYYRQLPHVYQKYDKS